MKFAKAESTVPEVDMTPMIDIVFQLIAFFMVITNFEQTQADERVKLPADRLARPSKGKKDKQLVINFGFQRQSDGVESGKAKAQVFYNGERIAPANLKDEMLDREISNYKSTGVDITSVVVVIRADWKVKTGEVKTVMQACQGVGFVKFALRAKQGDPNNPDKT